MGDDAAGAADEFRELLQELRVVLPGVQILLAFLFTVPFNARFDQLDDLERLAFGLAVVSAVAGIAFLIAPTAQHRIAWWRGSPRYDVLLPLASREALAGMAGVAISLIAASYLVIDVVYRQPLAALVGAAVTATIAWLWLLVPLRTKV